MSTSLRWDAPQKLAENKTEKLRVKLLDEEQEYKIVEFAPTTLEKVGVLSKGVRDGERQRP